MVEFSCMCDVNVLKRFGKKKKSNDVHLKHILHKTDLSRDLT